MTLYTSLHSYISQYCGINLNCSVLLLEIFSVSEVHERIEWSNTWEANGLSAGHEWRVLHDISNFRFMSCNFIRHIFQWKWYSHPFVFLIGICFYYQSKLNTLNTKRSFTFYNTFRSSSGGKTKRNGQVYFGGGLPFTLNALINSLASKVCNNCILISFDYHCLLINIIPLLEVLVKLRI